MPRKTNPPKPKTHTPLSSEALILFEAIAVLHALSCSAEEQLKALATTENLRTFQVAKILNVVDQVQQAEDGSEPAKIDTLELNVGAVNLKSSAEGMAGALQSLLTSQRFLALCTEKTHQDLKAAADSAGYDPELLKVSPELMTSSFGGGGTEK